MELSSNASASLNLEVPGVVLIRDTDTARGRLLESHFAHLGIAVDRNKIRIDSRQIDIAIVQCVKNADCDGLEEDIEALRRDSATEVILFAERNSSDLAVAEGLGLKRVLAADDLIRWITAAGSNLIRRARARRTLREIERLIPEPPPMAWSASHDSIGMSLHLAEQRFRESYLRRLLSMGRARDAMARSAGVPYRTLCQMIQKLGIDVPPRHRGRPIRSDKMQQLESFCSGTQSESFAVPESNHVSKTGREKDG